MEELDNTVKRLENLAFQLYKDMRKNSTSDHIRTYLGDELTDKYEIQLIEEELC